MGNTLKRLLPFLVNKKIRISNNELFNGKIPDKLLKSITDELEELDLYYCSSLTELPALPQGLQKLSLSYCSKLTTLPELPQGLQKLSLSYCSKLTTLPELPQGLQKLSLSDCSKLTTLPELPQGLQKLDLSDCSKLTTLPELPQGLQELYLSDCSKLTTLPALPEGLIVLELKSLNDLTTLPDLPSSLKKLNLKLFSNLTTLPALPEGLKVLELKSLNDLTTLPALPEGLKVLQLSWCRKLKTLPELPKGVRQLNLSYCFNLTTLPALPEGLKMLNLCECPSLTTLPELPQGLRDLNLSFCSNLTTLPDLPEDLQSLNLSGCNNLSIESIAKLEVLEKANRNNPNFRIIWPNNLSQNSYAIDTLKEAYRQFYSSNPNLAQIEPDVNDQVNYPTLFLLQRFTSESIETRGKRVIIAQAKLLAEEIKKNPQFLEILDQRSTDYLQACINQPVSGFAEIASLMAIVKEEDNSKKIEKAKILRAQQLIKNKIRSLINSSGQGVGEGFEVELGNAMLREVHKKLNKEKFIKEPWLGIPDNIAYGGSIRSFLNPQNIQEIYDEVKEALSDTPKSQKDFIEFFCEVETNFWAKTILTKEEREQAQHKTPEEKAQHEVYLKEQQDRIAILRNEIIDLDLNDEEQIFLKNQELQNIERDIENKHLKNLPQILEKKTRELLDQSQQYERSRSPSPIEIESSKASELFRSPRSGTQSKR